MVGDLEDINEMIIKQKVWTKPKVENLSEMFFKVHIFTCHFPL